MTTSSPTDRPVRLLLVDDDEDDYLLTKEVVAEMPHGRYRLEWKPDYDTGLAAIVAGGHDVYLIDYRIGAKSGLDLLAATAHLEQRGPMILLTGQGEFEIDQAALSAGAADYLEKGRLDATILERSIRYALQQRKTEQELEQKVSERTQSLAAANDLLKEADRRKDEFLATLAHELRNPLAPIRNALEILRLSNYSPTASQSAHAMMDRQVQQMVRLIDDLLDVSRITRGKLSLTLEPLDLSEVISEAIEVARPTFERSGITFEAQTPASPMLMTGDRVRLSQVLANIFANAAKYTEPGGCVTLSVTQDAATASIAVTDTGIGIPSEHLPKIFDLFTQIDRSLNRSQGGLGIGLSLVKQLVEMHGGTVHAHSYGPSQGATFTVNLPLHGGG